MQLNSAPEQVEQALQHLSKSQARGCTLPRFALQGCDMLHAQSACSSNTSPGCSRLVRAAAAAAGDGRLLHLTSGMSLWEGAQCWACMQLSSHLAHSSSSAAPDKKQGQPHLSMLASLRGLGMLQLSIGLRSRCCRLPLALEHQDDIEVCADPQNCACAHSSQL